MAKYIDVELLRKEIEFAKSVYSHTNRISHGVADAFRQDGRVAMCDDILKKIDSLLEEPDKSLEEAADEYADSIEGQEAFSYGADHYCWEDVHNSFIAGVEWQKTKMLKEAVGCVNSYRDSGGTLMVEAQVGCPYHNGDKIRIIIVKEENK